jgi:tryptophan-rich sensory protein
MADSTIALVLFLMVAFLTSGFSLIFFSAVYSGVGVVLVIIGFITAAALIRILGL